MAEEQDSGDWLRKFKSVFIKEDPSAVASQPATTPAKPAPASIPSVMAAPPAADLVDDLAQRFQKLVDEKNQPGFDFYEYSAMVLGVSQSPSPDHFKMAFQGAKVMNGQLSKKQLLDSAAFYKQTLENAYLDTIKKGEEKRQAIAQQQANEQKQLNTDLANIDKQIADLQQKIAQLTTSKTEKNAQLSSLNDKFMPQLADVESKLNATSSGKDKVLERLLLIEDGLNKFAE